MPKIIGIRFGDNDFYSTIIPWLKALGERGIDSYNFDKDKVVELFNRSASGFYWLCQNGLEYRTNDLSHIQSYLRIGPGQVFFDEEVKNYLEKHNGSNNCEFFVIDTSTYNREPYIYCV